MRDNQNFDDLPDVFSDASFSAATLELEGELDTCLAKPSEPRCENCDAPMMSDAVTICRRCGWYSSLGMCVELDQKWESDTNVAEGAPSTEPQKSHVRVWLDLMPRWSWTIIASVLVVVIESVAVRFATPEDGGLRTAWSLAQLGLGVIAVAACHIFNFVVLAAEDADFGVMDLFVKPLKLWLRAVRYLPTRLWVANTAACGLAAIIMSLVVIRGIPYERLWDWGFEQPVKQDLMGAVMDRAKELDSRNDDDLEEAIGDFAGSQDAAAGGELPKATPPKPRTKSDCVILGYQVDRDGRLSTLLLGSARRGKLTYAGRVTPEMSDDELSSLLMELTAIKSLQPFISIEAEATWVKPKFTCRITYGERLKGGQLRDVKWDRLLGSMKTN
ncbi:MAG: hypothetical protein L0228_02235 [Planctomycetes bacterium]|nr:hypothetical protein [Planctomycetota bacterium]